MKMDWKCALALVASVGAPGLAGAHDLVCEQTANGEPRFEISRYPAEVEFGFWIANVHPTSRSVVLRVEDASFPDATLFTPPAPFALPVGGSAEASHVVVIESYAACLALARSDGFADAHLDNVLRVVWDLGEAQCRARVTCCPPDAQGSCGSEAPVRGTD